MKKPTLEEINKLVTFDRHEDGELYVQDVNGTIFGTVTGGVEIVEGSVSYMCGNIKMDMVGDILGNVDGDIEGSVTGEIFGDVKCVHGNIKFIKNPNL